MVSTAFIVGGMVGFGIQVMANALQKLPVTREPYKHVLCTGLGCYAMDYMVQRTEEMKKIVAQKQQEKMEKSYRF